MKNVCPFQEDDQNQLFFLRKIKHSSVSTNHLYNRSRYTEQINYLPQII